MEDLEASMIAYFDETVEEMLAEEAMEHRMNVLANKLALMKVDIKLISREFAKAA